MFGSVELDAWRTEVTIMPVIVGLILGIILTIAATLAYDTSTGRAPNGLTASAAGGRAPLVNWDVVNADWNDAKAHLQNAGAEIERGWKRISG
jgi:hypothetical protein